MSRRIYIHLRTIGALKGDEINFKRPDNYGFSDAEFIAMNNRDRTRIVQKLKFLGFNREADRLKHIARIKITN
jgi:hypothetical protein